MIGLCYDQVLTTLMILTLASCLCSVHSHRINPVEGSTRKLQVSHTDSSISESEENGDSTRQTGFKHHWLGVVLHVCTLLTVVGWFGLLAGTTYLYYKYNADEENLIMSLKAFCLAWNLGLLWNFILKWPLSIESIFLRRCSLEEATQVVVYHETASCPPQLKEDDSVLPASVRAFISTLYRVHAHVMTLIFADVNARPNREKGVLEYCPVQANADGSKYFVFLFRRYNFDEKRRVYVPGSWLVGRTFAEIAPLGVSAVDEMELAYEEIFVGEDNEESSNDPDKTDGVTKYRIDPHAGLNEKEVKLRYSAVGPNRIDMRKPTYFHMCLEEIKKPFYVYQFYILWIWITIQYWYMVRH